MLATLLQGNARKLLPTQIDAPTPSFDELSEKLRARFTTEARALYFVSLLNSRQRRDKEGINELMRGIIELAAKAYQSMQTKE